MGAALRRQGVAGDGKNGMNGMSGTRRRARRFARRLGLDANPLRRRTDKIATWLMVQFLVVVLVGTPLFGIAAFNWAGRAGAAEPRAERSWRGVRAGLLDRRRLADWELAWAIVGLQWTKRFRSRG